MKKLKNIYLIVGAIPALVLVLLALAGVSGGTSMSQELAAPVVATEGKAEEYATVASKLGVPWEIVMLTDAIQSAADGKTGIEDKNPINTTLQFLILIETTEHYEVVGQRTDPETGNTYDTYGWVTSGVSRYFAKDEILNYFGITDTSLQGMAAEDLTALAVSEGASRSNSEWRYTLRFAANSNFEGVLQAYVAMDVDNIKKVMELYHAGYLGILNLTEEAREHIKAIQAECGLYQYVEGSEINCGDILFSDGGREVVYYNQFDGRWKDMLYGSAGTIGYEGCGPTAMSIVISTLSDTMVDPPYMADWSVNHGYRYVGSGFSRSLIPASAEAFGLTVSDAQPSEGQRIVDALTDGALVVAIMGKGSFTDNGHFIVLRAVTEKGKILVADPASVSRSEVEWDLALILREVSKTQAATGPFWIIQ